MATEVGFTVLVSIFLSWTLCKSVTLMLGRTVLLLECESVLLLLWLSVLVRVLVRVLVEEEVKGAGGAGGGGGALEPISLGTDSSSLDSGIAGKGAGMADAEPS